MLCGVVVWLCGAMCCVALCNEMLCDVVWCRVLCFIQFLLYFIIQANHASDVVSMACSYLSKLYSVHGSLKT